jgi:hypothetical protein
MNMKTKQFYFGMFIAIVAITFVACSSSDELIAEKGKALSLDASILQAQPMEISTRGISISSDTVFAGVMHYKEVEMSTSEISRAPLDDTPTWIGGEAITVKVDGKYFQYTIGSDGSSSTMTSVSPYYFTSLNNLTANVWYPSSGAANKTTHEVNNNQSSDANFKNSDLMYGSGTVSHNNLSNSITMAHKIAKVRVTVNVVNPSYLNNSTVNSVVLSGTKRSSSVGSNGALTASGSASDITMHKKSQGVFEACIIPQTATLTFKVNVGGTTYTSTAVASRAYAGNNIYTATIKITATKALYLGGSSVAIGDYYCMAKNGQAFVVKKASLSTAKTKDLTPLGVVFANTTSTKDQSNGWSLGYAMCVKQVDSKKWSSKEENDEVLPNMDTYEKACDYMDGYTDFMSIKNSAKISGGYTSDNYPAFYHANAIMTAPKTSSGFYLPSFGQFRMICMKLGGAPNFVKTAGTPTNIGSTGYMTIVYNITEVSTAPIIADSINTYLSSISNVYGASAIVTFPQIGHIWTSTEMDNRGAWDFDFCSGCKALHVYGYPKTAGKIVRPVIAF